MEGPGIHAGHDIIRCCFVDILTASSNSPVPAYYTDLEQNCSLHASLPIVDTNLTWLQIPVLVQSGYRVLAPDLKGFGQSDKPQDPQLYTMPNLVKDVLGILDQLQVRQVHCVVGHDWGAALAWQLAGRFPNRFGRLAALSVGHNASMFSMGGNQQREKSWYMLFFKVHIHSWVPYVIAWCLRAYV